VAVAGEEAAVVDPAADLVAAAAVAEVEDQGLEVVVEAEVGSEVADQDLVEAEVVAVGLALTARVEKLQALLCPYRKNIENLQHSERQPRWPVSRLVGPAYVELRCEFPIVSC
jgi:hypothetical protein